MITFSSFERTSVVRCESDMEFLAKVHCIRQASEVSDISQLSTIHHSVINSYVYII